MARLRTPGRTVPILAVVWKNVCMFFYGFDFNEDARVSSEMVINLFFIILGRILFDGKWFPVKVEYQNRGCGTV